MSLRLEVYCSMCGKQLYAEIYVGDVDRLEPEALKTRIEKEGWIVQFNDGHIDTYCSKKCVV